ncbi:MAG: sigma-70 family RNA polymerase sigma factor [Actinophytocola sp.]|uniref:RNA polymerase subunit sigma-70 n=1 Tax=Actinophytocola sp. TaxID=1872138 RepID=UPI001323495C|nr:RNA polymerase subunit sigma-70 [Actinophytocola sp.]MPZ82157.1 sigma-70 family RNA polymerase sigma factor [Actinophytocola sp.]
METEQVEVVAAARRGDESAFAQLTGRYRGQLQVHCYRMLGSVEDSEDLVQETFLRAWRRRETYAGRSTFRAWLYKIATNACLDLLGRKPRTALPTASTPPADPSAAPLPAVVVPWLQPCPDRLLDPDEVVVSRETVELAFLAAVQHLPPRQRAVLILRDVLGWSAKESAALLETTVVSANSALQRARVTMRAQLPERRLDWSPSAPSEEVRAVVARYMDALERADDAALGTMLREDARCSQAPWAGGNMTDDPVWYEGRDTLVAAWEPVFRGEHRQEFRCLPTVANGQPAVATYIRPPGGTDYQAFGLSVLRLVDGRIAEITVFGSELYPLFGLPSSV